MNIPNEKALQELFTSHVNEMQRLLNDVWQYLDRVRAPGADELRTRIENLAKDGKEIYEAIGKGD